MKSAEKVARVGAILDELYVEQPIPLDHRDPSTFPAAVVV